jgi:hypothetical protein
MEIATRNGSMHYAVCKGGMGHAAAVQVHTLQECLAAIADSHPELCALPIPLQHRVSHVQPSRFPDSDEHALLGQRVVPGSSAHPHVHVVEPQRPCSHFEKVHVRHNEALIGVQRPEQSPGQLVFFIQFV